MGRIRKFYEQRFRILPGDCADALFARAAGLARDRGISQGMALALVHARARLASGATRNFPRRFVCDAGLGGLARWLRGAGHEAHWNPDLDAPAVIREAQRLGATLITTDSLMMERGVLRDGWVPSVFVPSSITCEDQLVVVMAELDLPLREARCMHCGGALNQVEKAAVANRIPPRTALWLDEYFVCAACGKLFWRGTHWQRINRHLAEIGAEASRMGFLADGLPL